MKEIVVASGITAHRGYLIIKALFTANRRSQDHLHTAHVRLGLEDCLYLGLRMRYAVGSHTCDDARHVMVDVSAG